MIHTWIGRLGHLFIIIGFVSAILAAFSYYQSSRNELQEKIWKRFARSIFTLHTISIIGIASTLFFIIYNHYFEFHYAWSHSSRELPIHYMISCFWEGQEGSFLLWMFWQAILGIILIFLSKIKSWEAPVMTIFCLVQAFLVSMILGVVIGNIKIGSSPFILMRDAMGDIPIFQSNPNFVPSDGKGLNPLLQNYWMVIHPPTLFLGFALTLIPFAFCIAGLWKKQFKEWIKVVFPWALVGGLVLGIGILMGAYWAYETLNFGGYWNWDPVENSVYVPWVVLIASIHAMIVVSKNGKGISYAVILSVTSFLLVLYSTFLTRSGILGESSVHSFTDLGLSGQLLIYLLFFLIGSIFFISRSWKQLKGSYSISSYSSEFWILIGTIVLCLAAFQVIIPTSIPVWNAIVKLFGSSSKVAPPVDQILFYSKFQIWFVVFITILSGIGQFFWWKKIDKKTISSVFYLPVLLTLLISTILILIVNIKNLSYIILLTASVYSIISNVIIILTIAKVNPKLTGGALAHIGIALMAIGILFSSGYSNVLSKNKSGMIYSSELTEDINRDNLLLFMNVPIQMDQYSLTYKGQCVKLKKVPGYINKDRLILFHDLPFAIVKKEIKVGDKIYHSVGDTVTFYSENTYYQVEYKKNNGNIFTLFPRAQINPSMGLIASPAIYKTASRDLYTHVSAVIPPNNERIWSKPVDFNLGKDSSFIVENYRITLLGVEQISKAPGVFIEPGDVIIHAILKIELINTSIVEYVKTIFLIKENKTQSFAETTSDLGLKIQLMNIDPKKNLLTFRASTSQRDYIILKIVEKPFINILWFGTLCMIAGFIIAIRKKYLESKNLNT